MSPWRLAGTRRTPLASVQSGASHPTHVQARGVDSAGRVRADVPVPHGGVPEKVLLEQGFKAARIIDAAWEGDTFVLTFHVHPASWPGAMVRRVESAQSDEPCPADVVARQRVAAYCVGTSERGLLLTSLSAMTGNRGLWILPGGGVEAGEDPREAVIREVWEESGQRIDDVELVSVLTSHRVGQRASGEHEDFHAVRVIYRARCADPSEPVVHDVGGSTETAAWFDVAQVNDTSTFAQEHGGIAAWAIDAITQARQ